MTARDRHTMRFAVAMTYLERLVRLVDEDKVIMFDPNKVTIPAEASNKTHEDRL